MPELGKAKLSCAVENCAAAPAFQIFELQGTVAVALKTLCDRHARVLIEDWTLECSKTHVPPTSNQAAQFRVAKIVGSFQSSVLVIYLSSSDGSCFLFHIGKLEAWTLLALLTRQTRDNRPLTHESMANAIESLGGTLTHVVIDDVVGGALCAKLYIVRDGKTIVNDARPSDAIALAFVRSIPILVAPVALSKTVEALTKDNL